MPFISTNNDYSEGAWPCQESHHLDWWAILEEVKQEVETVRQERQQ